MTNSTNKPEPTITDSELEQQIHKLFRENAEEHINAAYSGTTLPSQTWTRTQQAMALIADHDKALIAQYQTDLNAAIEKARKDNPGAADDFYFDVGYSVVNDLARSLAEYQQRNGGLK